MGAYRPNGVWPLVSEMQRPRDTCLMISYVAPPIAVDPSVCYKNSTDDGVTWSGLLPLAVDAIQPTVVCDTEKATILLQFNVGVMRLHM